LEVITAMRIKSVVRKGILLATVIGLVSAVSVHAQTAAGEVGGTVTDPTGAAIPRASVTLSSENTKVSRTALANQDGRFIFTNVLTGVYTVQVEASGFKKVEKRTSPSRSIRYWP
jgi:hypothetical protein